MATAEARYYNEKYNLPVVFADKRTGQKFWSEVFTNNPRIVKNPVPGQQVVIVENHGGKRPYVDHVTPGRFHYNYKFKAEPGELYLTKQEMEVCLPGCVLVEPHTKPKDFNRNKAWPWERWQALVDSIDLPWVQMGDRNARTLNGVKRVITQSFRNTLGYLNCASMLVTTDGALHHAAAALGKPAVVLWGGLAPWQVLGYDMHINICHADHACGSVASCPHCHEAMESITVEEVRRAIEHH